MQLAMTRLALLSHLLLIMILTQLNECKQEMKHCNTLHLTSNDANATAAANKLHKVANGCQLVDGDVVLKNIGAISYPQLRKISGFENFSSDFLDSIEEINGRLIINNVNMRRLTFKNLKVIRGYNPYNLEDFYPVEILLAIHSMQLQLPQLTEVQRGNFHITGNMHADTYCHLTRNVDWKTLLRSDTQKLENTVLFLVKANEIVSVRNQSRVDQLCATAAKCNSLCPEANDGSNKTLCWSGGSSHGCQKSSSCSTRTACPSGTCSAGKVDEEEEEEEEICCHSSCLGGCSGTSASNCTACRGVSVNGQCREECPRSQQYDAVTGTTIDEKGMMRLGSVCLKQCPKPYLEDTTGSYCVTKCRVGETVAITTSGLKCRACPDCRSCSLGYRIMMEESEIRKCTDLSLTKATLVITGNKLSHIPPRPSASLSSVRVVYGSVMIRDATNVDFLRSLTFVSDIISIIRGTMTYIPLMQLQYTKGLFVNKVSSLCHAWFPHQYAKKSPHYRIVTKKVQFDNTSSVCRKAACDSECVDECWGPGAGQCVACKGVRFRGACVASCEAAGSFLENNTCGSCHAECDAAAGCRGPSATDCVRCRRFTEGGECVGRCSRELSADSDGVCFSAAASALPIVGAVAAGIGCALLLLLLASCCYYSHRISSMQQFDLEEALADPSDPNDMAQLLVVNDDDVVKQKEIGSGAFGTVFKGLLRCSTAAGIKELPVAVKVLRGSSPKLGQELLNEASVLARVKHRSCIRLVALCLTEEVQLITALMPRGSLLEFVKARRHRIGAARMLNWALQVAEGMAYLESVGIVHRDLAARNVLLQSPDAAKITDFGLAKLLNISEQELMQAAGHGERLPVKWLSLECFESGVFSHKSDVWSYGVLLWEICTFGESPYSTFNVRSVNDLVSVLRKGVRLQQPDVSSIDFYNIMLSCWLPQPESRPSFEELSRTMEECLEAPSKFIAARRTAATSSDISDIDLLRLSQSDRAVAELQQLNMYVFDPMKVSGRRVMVERSGSDGQNEGYLVPNSPVK